jgi:hypothetical protein
MKFSFALCPECLGRYRSLTHNPTCSYVLSTFPFCSLEWADEHPYGEVNPFPGPNHEQCRDSIYRLAAARTQLWMTGAVPEESKDLWAEAQRMIPNWPGFLRLSSNPEQNRELENLAAELDELLWMTAEKYAHITFTDKGGGLTEFSASRQETPHRPMIRITVARFPPMPSADKGGWMRTSRQESPAPDQSTLLVMEFAKGSAQALALEFYPEDADAFAEEMPKAKAALRKWRAKHGGQCEMVLFTVVSKPEFHSAIESVIQRVCHDETELSPLLQSLEVRVALHNLKEVIIKEYVLAKAKPWWRFW